MTTQTITAYDLLDNASIALHNSGNLAHITGEVYFSSTNPGMVVVVETAFGSLYLDADEAVENLL